MSKEDLSSLITKVTNVKPKVSIQKVVEQNELNKKTSVNINTKIFSFYIDKKLLKKLKTKALKEDKSLKNIMHEALNKYLESSDY